MRLLSAGSALNPVLNSHVLMEPTVDSSLAIIWPARHDAGSLQWQANVPAECQYRCYFCDALLFPAECVQLEGYRHRNHGLPLLYHGGSLCCHAGTVHFDAPKQTDETRHLWLGPKGEQHGPDGLLRSTLQKHVRHVLLARRTCVAECTSSALSFAERVHGTVQVRVIHQSVAMASQTVNMRHGAALPGSNWNPCVVLHGTPHGGPRHASS